MHRTQLLAALLAAAAVSGTAAATASADSLAYVKSGNVYLTPGDLSREFQVTATGGYSAVSQADDGTLLATAGGQLRHLDRYGNILADIATPVSGQGNSSLDSFFGPYNADISPDGKTAAYGYVHQGWTTGSSGYTNFEQRNGTGFSASSALTGFTDPGYHYTQDWDAPEFIDNQTVLLSNGPGYPSDPISVETVGSNDPRGWFTDPDNPHPLDATISRSHRLIAAVVGPARQGLVVYRDQDGQLLGNVDRCFTFSDSGAYKYESPTFNADGTRLYWSDGTKLESAPVGDMSTTCAAGQPGAASLAGTSPDWGPADVPTVRPTTPGTTATPTQPAIPGGSTKSKSSSPSRRAQLTVLAPSDAKRDHALGFGITVRVRSSQAGTIAVIARLGRATVALGRARAAHPGTIRVTLTITRYGRRMLRHRRHAALLLTAIEGRARASVRIRLDR